MNFAKALERIIAGYAVAREGWNGKGMFVGIVPTWAFTTLAPEHAEQLKPEPFIAIRWADGRVTPWTPSQLDMLATDWWELEA